MQVHLHLDLKEPRCFGQLGQGVPLGQGAVVALLKYQQAAPKQLWKLVQQLSLARERGRGENTELRPCPDSVPEYGEAELKTF